MKTGTSLQHLLKKHVLSVRLAWLTYLVKDSKLLGLMDNAEQNNPIKKPRPYPKWIRTIDRITAGKNIKFFLYETLNDSNPKIVK